MSTFLVILIAAGVFVYLLISSKKANEKQKELLQTQAEKRGGQLDASSSNLLLKVGNLILQICPIPSRKGVPAETHAVLGAQSIEELVKERSRFPKITIVSDTWLQNSTAPNGHTRVLFGDEKFDKAFIVYGENEADVRRVLTDEIRQKLSALLPKSPFLKTYPDSTSTTFFSTVGVINNSEGYDLYIDTIVSILTNLA